MTGGPTTIVIEVFSEELHGDSRDDGSIELVLPAKFELCPRCRGVGSHVNPAVDGHGITAQEFAEDPDFQESYFAGVYDVACHRCKGEKVIKVVDRERAKARDLELYDEHERALRELEAEEAAERRFGC